MFECFLFSLDVKEIFLENNQKLGGVYYMQYMTKICSSHKVIDYENKQNQLNQLTFIIS